MIVAATLSWTSYIIGLLSGVITSAAGGILVWRFQAMHQRRVAGRIDEVVANDPRLCNFRSEVQGLYDEWCNENSARSFAWWRRDMIKALQRMYYATPDRTRTDIADASLMSRIERFAQQTDDGISRLNRPNAAANKTTSALRMELFAIVFPLHFEGEFLVRCYAGALRSQVASRPRRRST